MLRVPGAGRLIVCTAGKSGKTKISDRWRFAEHLRKSCSLAKSGIAKKNRGERKCVGGVDKKMRDRQSTKYQRAYYRAEMEPREVNSESFAFKATAWSKMLSFVSAGFLLLLI